MQTDGDEARLASHEAGSFCHHSQRLGLLVWLGLDDCDLCDGLFVGLDLRHGRPHFIELNLTLPLDFTEYNILCIRRGASRPPKTCVLLHADTAKPCHSRATQSLRRQCWRAFLNF